HSVVALTGTQCEVSASARVNCGFPGITATECENKGCCFDSAIQGAPWCFHAQTKDVRSQQSEAKTRRSSK
ncbi:trefoil factor 1, partial [Pelobates cultripes]